MAGGWFVSARVNHGNVAMLAGLAVPLAIAGCWLNFVFAPREDIAED
jgi:hypothetical protein